MDNEGDGGENRVQGCDHLYLGYEALCDGHGVGVALLKIMKEVPKTITMFKEISM